MTLKGSFEPMVMFFGLTNSPATFQTIMNEILWDLIDIREVASFIDDIIVGMKEEKKYNEIVEKVVKRLAKKQFVYETRKVQVEG